MKYLTFQHATTWLSVLAFCTFSMANLLGLSAESEKTAQVNPPATASSALKWFPDETGVSLMQGDTLILRYESMSGSKPIVYPILGPGGVNMTRDFPMKEAGKGQTKDHIHHRSLWMTHGEVNGIDFWAEGEKAGRIVHENLMTSEIEASAARLVTTANWLAPDGKKLLHETRTMIVTGDESLRGIEFSIDLKAGEHEVRFGDTKEGSFGIRVPDSMAVDQKLGGTILNEHGDRDDDTWGKRSRWVDYSGPVGDKVAGLTLLEHPSSFGHPCRWHVRTYGLFAANPFGEHHFVGGKPTKGQTLQPGQTLHLQYKLLVHAGDADKDLIEDQWKQFAK